MRAAAFALCALLSCHPKASPTIVEKKPEPLAPSDFTHRAEELNGVLKEASSAYQGKDFTTFASKMEAATRLSPYNPDLQYRLARAYWLSAKKQEALQMLEALGKKELVYPLDHPDLAGLAEAEGYAAVSKALAPKEKHPSVVLASLEAPDLLIEGIAFDKKTGSFYISSVHQRAIYRLEKDGALTLFAKNKYGAFGMAIDEKRRLLWVASSVVAETKDATPEEKGRAGVSCFDLETGEQAAFYEASDDKERVFGDLALMPNGEVIVTDSITGEIYSVSGGKLGLLVSSGYLRSPQGVAVAPDGSGFLVSDYASGLYWVERETLRVYWEETPESVSRYGTDGIYWQGDTLYAIQNGTRPPRVLRLRMDGRRLVGAEVLEVGHSELLDPTLGTVADGKFCYVANSQWGNFEGASLAKETTPVRLWCLPK